MSPHPSKTRADIEANLALARQNGDAATEAECLLVLGDIAKESEEYDLAQGLYGQAWAAYKKAGDIQNQAHSLKRLGDLFAQQEESIEAHLMYDQALSLYRSVSDHQGEAQTLCAKGDSHVHLFQTEEAQPYYRAALSLFRSIGDRVGEADAAYGLSEALREKEHEHESLGLLYQSLDLYERLDHKVGQLKALVNFSNYASRCDLELAHLCIERRVALHQQLGNLQQQAVGLLSLSEIRVKQENRQAALAHCEQSLAISIFLKDHEGTRSALNEIHGITIGRNAPAPVAHLERCLSIYHQIHHIDGEITTLLDMGANAIREQDLSRARDLIQKASSLNKQFPEADKLELKILEALADLTQSEGNLEMAFEYYKQMLPLVEALRHDESFAQFVEEIGDLLLDMNEIDQAMIYFQQSCDLWQGTTERHRKASLLGRVAEIERKRKNYDKAHHALQQALDILKSYPPWLLSSVYWRLGALEGDQNHDDAARRHFQQAWDIEEKRFRSLSPNAQQRSRSITRVEILWHWGRFEWSHGNQPLGCNYCRQAITSLLEQPDKRLMQYRIPYETWREEFAAMNCPTLPDSETSHDA
jgi:tetratricopeptide (TPR) repeat protein